MAPLALVGAVLLSAHHLGVPKHVNIHLVQTKKQLAGFEKALTEKTIDAIGIDLEWRPRTLYATKEAASNQHAALLQVATRKECFVIDLLAICHPLQLPECAHLLRSAISGAMRARDITKLGFDINSDLVQIESVPGLEGATQGAVSIRDVQADACTMLGISRKQPIGLSKLAAALFGAPIDKSLQTSDWASRPLTRDQLLYAATDAWVLLPLADALDSLAIEMRNGQAGKAKSMPHVKGTRTIDDRARVPIPVQGTPNNHSKKGKNGRTNVKDPIALQGTPSARLNARVDDLRSAWVGRRPPRVAGMRTGSRYAAHLLCAGHAEDVNYDIIASGSGGLTQWANADALFVNIDSSRTRYKNQFWTENLSDASIYFNWFPGFGLPVKSRTVARLLSAESSVLLFCRRNAGCPFYFCGGLSAHALLPTISDPAGNSEPYANIRTWGMTTADGHTLGAQVVWRLLDSHSLIGNYEALAALFGSGSAKDDENEQDFPLLRQGRPDCFDC